MLSLNRSSAIGMELTCLEDYLYGRGFAILRKQIDTQEVLVEIASGHAGLQTKHEPAMRGRRRNRPRPLDLGLCGSSVGVAVDGVGMSVGGVAVRGTAVGEARRTRPMRG